MHEQSFTLGPHILLAVWFPWCTGYRMHWTVFQNEHIYKQHFQLINMFNSRDLWFSSKGQRIFVVLNEGSSRKNQTLLHANI